MDAHQQRWSALPRTLFGPVSPNADRRDLYLAVLACYEDSFVEMTLNLEELSRRLVASHPELADQDLLIDTLGQLVTWGHLAASRDESASYSDPTEFRNRTLQ